MTKLKPSDLSPRLLDIARKVGQGLSYNEIARGIPSKRSIRGGTIRPRTVQMHVATIAARIGHDHSSPRERVMRWILEHDAQEAARQQR